MFLVNKSFIKFITDFGPLLVFFSFYYRNEKNLTVAIPPFIVATLIAILVVWIFGAVFISLVEPGAFKDIRNSLWWAIVTMTTVGYGDMAPTTNIGRFLAIIIMTSGIILIAIITATI